MNKTNSKHIRLDLCMLILVFGINALIIFLITPIRTVYGMSATTPPWFNDLLTTISVILETAAMTSGFSILAVVYFMDIKKKYKYFLVYVGGLVFKRIALFGTSFLTYRLLDELPEKPADFAEFFMDQIFMSLEVFLWDCLFLLAVALICYFFAKKQAEKNALQKKVSSLLNDETPAASAGVPYPFKKIYSIGNLLQSCLLVIAILFAGINIVIRTSGLIVFGATESIPSIIGGYATDILLFVISYALACFLITSLNKLNGRRIAKSGL